jgi:hypothetical protein
MAVVVDRGSDLETPTNDVRKRSIEEYLLPRGTGQWT